MRVAILSSLKRTDDAAIDSANDLGVDAANASGIDFATDADGEFCAALMAGNRSVLDRQVELAVAAGCERIACLADGLEQHIIDAQNRAEKAGLKFTIVREKLALSGVIKAADTIVVIADGLMFPQALAPDLLGTRNCVVSLPVEPAMAAGFERIDREKAWAGVLLTRGSLAEELSDLPDDFGIESSLLRLALQDGCPIAQADIALLNSGDLTLAYKPDDVRNWFERRLVHLLPAPDKYRPSIRVSDFLVRKLVSTGKNLQTRAAIALGIWGMMLAVAVMLGIFITPAFGPALGSALGPALGIAVLPFAALTFNTGIGIERLRFDDAKLPRSVQILDSCGPYCADMVWIGLAALSVKTEMMVPMAFAAAIWVGVQILLRLLDPAPTLRLLTDRPLVYLLLAIVALLDHLLLATQILGFTVLAALIFTLKRPDPENSTNSASQS